MAAGSRSGSTAKWVRSRSPRPFRRARANCPPASEPDQSFTIEQAGTLEVAGPGGRAWDIRVIPDNPPEITADGPLERTATGELRQPFSARDDYGVETGTARIALDLEAVDRRHGLAADPEPRDPIELDLPMPIAGGPGRVLGGSDRGSRAASLGRSASDHRTRRRGRP